MNRLDQQYPHEFLSKWIHGKLTTKELHSFVSSTLYKNLVFSTELNDTSKK